MSAEPLNAWDARVLLASESAFGTPPNPAAAQAVEIIGIDMGPIELGEIRAKKDRAAGRGATSGFVEGRIKPIPFSLDLCPKVRSAIDANPESATIYAAAGLVKTTNASTSVVYSLSGTPIESAFSGLSIYRSLGQGSYIYEAEQGRGGVVKTLQFSGGDKELSLKASGEMIGKYHLGYSSSITLADGSGTTLTFASAEEAQRFGIGWYSCQNEVIKITAVNTAGPTATIARAQLSTTGAAHAAQPLIPYYPPSGVTYTGVPISEATTCTITIGGVTIRVLSWTIDFTTGMDLLPGETGSAYVQGVKAVRCDVKASIKVQMKREDVALLGKASRKTAVAATLVQGSATGGVYTFSLPYCEIDAFKVPDGQDVVEVDLSLRAREGSGNDMFSFTLT